MRGVRTACHAVRAASFRKSTPCKYLFDQDLTESSHPRRPNPLKTRVVGLSRTTHRKSAAVMRGAPGTPKRPWQVSP
ncbi:hypothetical protein STAFG_7513 [Streptomyces afghaniensis 772]|uniref:Uncharacterized protein n=1 Tax=Streptomyces afghaniensis 772 TaxID=1283301 RepID=S4MIN0_9ACTN|nr:hypothetical protein STAFG_7513 [Streptomyces afghaniensis 772]